MKTKNYSRLLLTFVSSIYMATTVGLSAKPGLSYGHSAICIYDQTQELVRVYGNNNKSKRVQVYSIDKGEWFEVSLHDLSNCFKQQTIEPPIVGDERFPYRTHLRPIQKLIDLLQKYHSR